MLHTDERFAEAIEAKVAEIERTTDAELVVVAAERSGSYEDLADRGASLVTLIALAVILYIPYGIAEPWVLVDCALTWLGVRWLLRHRRWVRWLSTADRRRAQVSEAAEREFHREVVHGTPNRSGVLVYVSATEGLVEVLPDLGIAGKVPPAVLAQATRAFAHDDLDHFLQGLDALGALLAEHVPHLASSDDVDLPNTPRIRG